MDTLRPSAAMESIVEQLQAAGRRVLEGLSEAELRDRIEQLQRQLQLKAGDTVGKIDKTGDYTY